MPQVRFVLLLAPLALALGFALAPDPAAHAQDPPANTYALALAVEPGDRSTRADVTTITLHTEDADGNDSVTRTDTIRTTRSRTTHRVVAAMPSVCTLAFPVAQTVTRTDSGAGAPSEVAIVDPHEGKTARVRRTPLAAYEIISGDGEAELGEDARARIEAYRVEDMLDFPLNAISVGTSWTLMPAAALDLLGLTTFSSAEATATLQRVGTPAGQADPVATISITASYRGDGVRADGVKVSTTMEVALTYVWDIANCRPRSRTGAGSLAFVRELEGTRVSGTGDITIATTYAYQRDPAAAEIDSAAPRYRIALRFPTDVVQIQRDTISSGTIFTIDVTTEDRTIRLEQQDAETRDREVSRRVLSVDDARARPNALRETVVRDRALRTRIDFEGNRTESGPVDDVLVGTTTEFAIIDGRRHVESFKPGPLTAELRARLEVAQKEPLALPTEPVPVGHEWLLASEFVRSAFQSIFGTGLTVTAAGGIATFARVEARAHGNTAETVAVLTARVEGQGYTAERIALGWTMTSTTLFSLDRGLMLDVAGSFVIRMARTREGEKLVGRGTIETQTEYDYRPIGAGGSNGNDNDSGTNGNDNGDTSHDNATPSDLDAVADKLCDRDWIYDASRGPNTLRLGQPVANGDKRSGNITFTRPDLLDGSPVPASGRYELAKAADGEVRLTLIFRDRRDEFAIALTADGSRMTLTKRSGTDLTTGVHPLQVGDATVYETE